jgi:hypothetical protein
VLAETYGRNGIKKVVRSLNPRRKGIILKNSLLASEVSVNRPAQAASPPSAGDYRYLVACLRVRAAECFRAKASLRAPAKQSIASRKNGLLRCCASSRKRFAFVAGNDENSEGLRFLSARLRPPGLVSRTCAASAVAARCRFPDRVARSTIRRQPAGRRGMLAKPAKTKPMCRRPSGYWNSSPARAPSARRGQRSPSRNEIHFEKDYDNFLLRAVSRAGFA